MLSGSVFMRARALFISHAEALARLFGFSPSAKPESADAP
jgi:hypothetical protein